LKDNTSEFFLPSFCYEEKFIIHYKWDEKNGNDFPCSSKKAKIFVKLKRVYGRR